jgi:hypothetical protein
MFEWTKGRLSIAILVAGCAGAAIPVNADVINGDFSSGNTGFTSGYGYAASSDPGGGHYTVAANAHTWNSALSSFGDHTTGSGLMLIADGSGTANTALWTETSLPVAPNTQYTFSFYAASNGNDDGNGIDPSPATLFATANGVQFGSTLDVSPTNGTWTYFTGTFNSGALSAISLAITDSNTNGGDGNDFAIDDISLAPEPGSLALILCAAGISTLGRRRRTV